MPSHLSNDRGRKLRRSSQVPRKNDTPQHRFFKELFGELQPEVPRCGDCGELYTRKLSRSGDVFNAHMCPKRPS